MGPGEASISKANVGKSKEELKAEEKETEKLASSASKRIFWMNMQQWPYIVVGTIASIGAGLVFPFYAIIFSEMMEDLFFDTGANLEDNARFWALMFVALGVGTFIFNYLFTAMFAISGETLTHNIRMKLFLAMVSQEVGWFDAEENSTGILATRLATDSTAIQGVSAIRVGVFVQALASLGGGLAISLWACWRVCLVVIATIPIMAFAGFLQLQAMMGYNNEAKEAFENAGHISGESISNIKTVVALGQEQRFIDRYASALEAPVRASLRAAHVNAFGFGFGEGLPFFVFALAFWYGSIAISDQFCDFSDVMTAIMAILFGAMTMGQLGSIAPDAGKAKTAAIAIFKIIDREPKIDALKEEGKTYKKVSGKIEFKDVRFAYPTRPEQEILKGVSFTAEPGQTVALVGSSGCGKSTIIQLMQRFYDPASGSIKIDGKRIDGLNTHWMRSHIGFVQQEPVLFGTTIGTNIEYGKPGASQKEVESSAKQANCHDFISSKRMPEHYDTLVGEKGGRMSGGQKQRIAIARALIRDPVILLLDEATSALDSESEKLVQEALDKASKGRTTLVIAHRLSTIRNADKIVVFSDGEVIEEGTHDELMENESEYYELVRTTVQI